MSKQIIIDATTYTVDDTVAAQILELESANQLLQQLWVTVNISCTPGDCEDAEVLKRYMKACMVKADEYEAFIQSLDKERDDNE